MYPCIPPWGLHSPLPPRAGYINTNKEVWGIVLNNMRLIEEQSMFTYFFVGIGSMDLCLHISLQE